MYQQYTHPLARIVRGLPISWGPNVTTLYHEDFEGEVAWSPCSRFIAVAKTTAVEVLDAVTLKRLNKFESPASPTTPLLSFSPDGRYLTQFSDWKLARWDLQTADPLGAILSGPDVSPMIPFSSAYPVDGKAVAVAWKTRPYNDTFITTYDLVSMAHMGSYRLPGTRIIAPIWTHGELLRFATVKRGSIAVWEARFALTHEPAEVESFPAPDETADGEHFLFLPSLSRLAFTLRGSIFVWDAKDSGFLLKSGPVQASQVTQAPAPPRFSSGSSFSSDGRFFACMTVDREVYVWEYSGYEYLLHQKLRFATAIVRARPLLSPSGELVIASIRPTIHLWTTKDQILSNPPTQDGGQNFVLALSPNETLVAFARRGGTTVTLLDLVSGKPRLIIDAGTRLNGVLCLGMTDDTIVVVYGQKVVTWNVTAEKCTLNARANMSDSIRTSMFPSRSGRFPYASLSPDLSRVVIVVRWLSAEYTTLVICDVSTGREVRCVNTAWVEPQLTRGGHQLWDISGPSVEGWKIVQDGEPNPSNRSAAKPKLLKPTKCPSDVFPWRSTRGHKVTDDGWILGPTQKRILWLPHDWRFRERDRMWKGQFLGLLHGGLPEVVILEFLE